MSVVRLPEKISFTADQLQKTAAVFNVTVPEKDVEAYRVLLSGLDEAAKAIAAEDDYLPPLDLIRFPRENVHRPETNEYNAWAYKVTIKSTSDVDASGLLAGKTVAIKDNVCIGQVPSLLGTDVIPEGGFLPEYDATVVTRVLAAGATVLGKGACENFSMSPGRDGYDDRQIGLPVPVPSYVDELANYKDDPKQAAKGARIGLVVESFDMPGLDPRVVAKVKQAAKALEALGVGVTVEEISVPMHAKAPAIWTIATRQGFSEHGLCGQNPVRFGVHDAGLNTSLSKWNQEMFDRLALKNPAATNALLGGQVIKDNYPGLTDKAINLARKLKDEYNAVLDRYDVLITPCAPSPANYTSSLEDDIMTKMSKAIGTTINTAPFNISGNPAMSLPICMMSSQEDDSLMLPVGMQIVGKSFGELDIYKVAYAWEQSFDWKSF